MPRDFSDHFLLMSNLSCLGHLHQVQVNFDLKLLDHRHRLTTPQIQYSLKMFSSINPAIKLSAL